MDVIFNDAISEPEWMEQITPYYGLRVWHLGFFGLGGILSVGELNYLFESQNSQFSQDLH